MCGWQVKSCDPFNTCHSERFRVSQLGAVQNYTPLPLHFFIKYSGTLVSEVNRNETEIRSFESASGRRQRR